MPSCAGTGDALEDPLVLVQDSYDANPLVGCSLWYAGPNFVE
jgi:hypothetical protein